MADVVAALYAVESDDYITRAVWWDDGFHAVFKSGAVAALSADARVCVVRSPADAAARMSLDPQRHYVTSLCALPSDMKLISLMMRVRNILFPYRYSCACTPRSLAVAVNGKETAVLRDTIPRRHGPFLCRTLLPANTPILRAAASAGVPQPAEGTVAHWAGAGVEVDTETGCTRIKTQDGVASLTLYPAGDVFTVTYLAQVRGGVEDRTASVFSITSAEASEGGAQPSFVMHTELHYTDTRLLQERDGGGAAPSTFCLWEYPLRKALGLPTHNIHTSTRLPECPTLIRTYGVGGTDADCDSDTPPCGSSCATVLPADSRAVSYTQYPALLEDSVYNASSNLLRSFASVAGLGRADKAGSQKDRASVCLNVFERRHSAVYQIRRHANGANALEPEYSEHGFSYSALILHDLSVLRGGVMGASGQMTFWHHGSPVMTDARLVRLPLDCKSPTTGQLQYCLGELMVYLHTAQCEAGREQAPVVRPTAASSAVKRHLIEGVGEATFVGSRFSIRFSDRCILRMTCDGTDPSAHLLLPTGQSVSVNLDSLSVPDELQAYCSTALEVLASLQEESSKRRLETPAILARSKH